MSKNREFLSNLAMIYPKTEFSKDSTREESLLGIRCMICNQLIINFSTKNLPTFECPDLFQ